MSELKPVPIPYELEQARAAAALPLFGNEAHITARRTIAQFFLRTCPRCSGRGELSQTFQAPDGKRNSTPVECDDCTGSGRQWVKRPPKRRSQI